MTAIGANEKLYLGFIGAIGANGWRLWSAPTLAPLAPIILPTCTILLPSSYSTTFGIARQTIKPN